MLHTGLEMPIESHHGFEFMMPHCQEAFVITGNLHYDILIDVIMKVITSACLCQNVKLHVIETQLPCQFAALKLGVGASQLDLNHQQDR